MISKSEGLLLGFLFRADEFYILTRYCNRAFFYYLTFRMAHHTIEFYLKAGLSAYLSVKEMKGLGHNLNKLWKEYSARRPELNADARVISHINGFETMRYPGESRFVGTLWGPSYGELFSEILPKISKGARDSVACFSLTDFDKVVRALRTSLPDGDRLPFMAVTDDAQTYLYSENRYFFKERPI